MRKSFSILQYLFAVILFSWPFQLLYVLKAQTAFDKYLYSSLSMVMVAVATFIAARFTFKDLLANAAWRWGKPFHYILVLLLALFIWLVPSIIELATGMHTPNRVIMVWSALGMFVLRFTATLLPAFGEEFGWRGYMLPKLAERQGAKRGLLIHAFIWWFWHLPVVIGIGLHSSEVSNHPFTNVIAICVISVIPTMLHAVIFAFIWAKTKSLAVVTVYHAAFDEVRDTLENGVGFGPLVNSWQMIVIIITGGLLLWKVNWDELLLKNTAHNLKPYAHEKGLRPFEVN